MGFNYSRREMSAVRDLDAEQEVDFGRYWRAIVARWWLPVAGLVVGAIIGALVTIGGSSSWKATAQVYLGQPMAPGGGGVVSSPPLQLGLITNYIHSDLLLKTVADKVGLKVGRLRGHVDTKPLTGVTGAKLGTPAPLLEITVKGSPPAKIAAAANELAAQVATKSAVYQTAKIQTLRDRLAFQTEQLNAVDARLAAARGTQARVLSDKSISATDKLVTISSLNALITQALAQQIGLAQDRFGIRQALTLAQDVEMSRVTAPAVATRAAGPSRRTALAIGAFIGLLVGIFAALLWEPLGLPARPQ
jgi:hypothetical protein